MSPNNKAQVSLSRSPPAPVFTSNASIDGSHAEVLDRSFIFIKIKSCKFIFNSTRFLPRQNKIHFPISLSLPSCLHWGFLFIGTGIKQIVIRFSSCFYCESVWETVYIVTWRSLYTMRKLLIYFQTQLSHLQRDGKLWSGANGGFGQRPHPPRGSSYDMNTEEHRGAGRPTAAELLTVCSQERSSQISARQPLSLMSVWFLQQDKKNQKPFHT